MSGRQRLPEVTGKSGSGAHGTQGARGLIARGPRVVLRLIGAYGLATEGRDQMGFLALCVSPLGRKERRR